MADLMFSFVVMSRLQRHSRSLARSLSPCIHFFTIPPSAILFIFLTYNPPHLSLSLVYFPDLLPSHCSISLVRFNQYAASSLSLPLPSPSSIHLFQMPPSFTSHPALTEPLPTFPNLPPTHPRTRERESEGEITPPLHQYPLPLPCRYTPHHLTMIFLYRFSSTEVNLLF